MKKIIKNLILGTAFLPYIFAVAAPRAYAVTLEVMDPRGEIPAPPFHAPSERIEDLNGRKVGIYWIGKAGGDNFWDGIEELLNKQYPNTTTVRYRGDFDLGDELATIIAGEVDTVLYGVGD